MGNRLRLSVESHFMTSSQMTRVINWVAMLIAVFLLAVVAQHIYQRHFAQQLVGEDFRFDDLPAQSKAPLSTDINAIVNQHIFGQLPKAPTKVMVKKPKPKTAPKTRLNISLTGIISGATPETGMAMLEVERGKTLVVSVGEEIAKTNAVLHQVLPGEVLIDRDGVLESVKMVRKTLSLARLEPQDNGALPQPYIELNDPATFETNRPVRRQENPEPQILPLEARQPSRNRNRQEKGPMGKLPVPRALKRL